jgi:hypothetical protein
MWQNRVLKGAFGAKVGRALAVHVEKQGVEGSVWGQGGERIGCACGTYVEKGNVCRDFCGIYEENTTYENE